MNEQGERAERSSLLLHELQEGYGDNPHPRLWDPRNVAAQVGEPGLQGVREAEGREQAGDGRGMIMTVNTPACCRCKEDFPVAQEPVHLDDGTTQTCLETLQETT